MLAIPCNLKHSTYGIEPFCMPPTPGNFSQTPKPPVCSPPANQIFDVHLNTPVFNNIPLARQSSIVTRKISGGLKYKTAAKLCIIFFQIELTQLLVINRINQISMKRIERKSSSSFYGLLHSLIQFFQFLLERTNPCSTTVSEVVVGARNPEC